MGEALKISFRKFPAKKQKYYFTQPNLTMTSLERWGASLTPFFCSQSKIFTVVGLVPYPSSESEIEGEADLVLVQTSYVFLKKAF